jgi:L-ascorbate metabolism protein UlaG (beta-lactamase superfamily)
MIVCLGLLLALPLAALAGSATGLTWYGQSAFGIKTPAGKVLLIDPWIVNPLNRNGARDLAALEKVDFILISHGHNDHVGSAVEIATRTGARLVTTNDLAKALVQYGGFPEKQVERAYLGFPGGEVTLLDGEVRVLFVPAVHSSSLEAAAGSSLPGKLVYAGQAGGFVISIKDGPTIYHTGDTDLFSDMALIGSLNRIDIMLACIGGQFTMGPQRAALAVRLVNPGVVVPMHFGANKLAAGTPAELEKEIAALPKGGPAPPVRRLEVGETFNWQGKSR